MNFDASDSDNNDDYYVNVNDDIRPEVNENSAESSVQNENIQVVESDADSM